MGIGPAEASRVFEELRARALGPLPAISCRSWRRARSCAVRTFPLEPAACAPIAQLVEHVIRNDGVGGSIPSRGTITATFLSTT